MDKTLLKVFKRKIINLMIVRLEALLKIRIKKSEKMVYVPCEIIFYFSRLILVVALAVFYTKSL